MSELPPAQLALYDKLVATNPEIERKGATMPYTSHNEHMFSFMDKDGVVAIRLPEKERNEFIKKYKTELMLAHGTVMKEYVAVPATLLKKTKELSAYLDISLEYIKTLKPKPTTKKKK